MVNRSTESTATGRWSRLTAAALIAALAPAPLAAQDVVEGVDRVELTLEQAIDLARRNNPNFLSQQNDEETAEWQVRAAYGAFLPSVNASSTVAYTEPGVQRIGNLDFGAASTDYYRSGYNLGVNLSLDGNTFFQVTSARANRAATMATIDAAAFNLASAVTLQYMSALRARDGVEVARRTLERAEQNEQLVGARVEAGAAAATEGKQAEVQRGRGEVGLIQAERLLRAEKLRLMEQMGVPLGDEVVLVTSLPVFEPGWTREQLLEHALAEHPQLEAREATERAMRAGVRQARSNYFPSINLSTGWSGSTVQAGNETFLLAQAMDRAQNNIESCQFFNAIANGMNGPLPGYPQDCSRFTFGPQDQASLLADNDVFPFNFTKNPLSVALTVSVPVFTGFNRQRQVEQAVAQARDAEQARRAEELRLRTAVTQALDDLESAYQVVQIEERNREVAEEQRELARQRYALGAAPFLELLDAETSMATAERDYLNALYGFHQALVGLEAATGRQLRPEPQDTDAPPEETTSG